MKIYASAVSWFILTKFHRKNGFSSKQLEMIDVRAMITKLDENSFTVTVQNDFFNLKIKFRGL